MVGAAVACGLGWPQQAPALLDQVFRDIRSFFLVMVFGCVVLAASSPYTRSLRTAIIDGSVFHGTDETKSVPDPRVSAVTPSTVSFFKGRPISCRVNEPR